MHVAAYPFRCGGININHGYQLSEVFNYAIQYINKGNGIFSDTLRDITLGTLNLDVCQSSVNAVNILTDALSGSLDDSDVDIKKIVGAVGAFDTDVSIEAGRMLSKMNIPQISYASPVTEYSARDGSPAFLRAVPSSDVGSRALVAILKQLDVQYVQVVYSESAYGLSSSKMFNNLAQSHQICIAQNISFYPNDIRQNITKTLLSKPTASVIVVLLDNPDIRPFLMALSISPVAAKTFKLIASQTWGHDLDVLQGLDEFIANTITIGVDTTDIKDFDEYLEMQIPEIANPDNPWYSEYYEAMYECTLMSTASGPYQCVSPFQSPVRSPLYKQDKYALHTINSVFAVAIALHESLNELCGQGAGICQQFWDNKNQKIAEKMKAVEFEDVSGNSFKLLNDGSSNKGFRIYTVSGSSGSFYYSNVSD